MTLQERALSDVMDSFLILPPIYGATTHQRFDYEEDIQSDPVWCPSQLINALDALELSNRGAVRSRFAAANCKVPVLSSTLPKGVPGSPFLTDVAGSGEKHSKLMPPIPKVKSADHSGPISARGIRHRRGVQRPLQPITPMTARSVCTPPEVAVQNMEQRTKTNNYSKGYHMDRWEAQTFVTVGGAPVHPVGSVGSCYHPSRFEINLNPFCVRASTSQAEVPRQDPELAMDSSSVQYQLDVVSNIIEEENLQQRFDDLLRAYQAKRPYVKPPPPDKKTDEKKKDEEGEGDEEDASSAAEEEIDENYKGPPCAVETGPVPLFIHASRHAPWCCGILVTCHQTFRHCAKAIPDHIHGIPVLTYPPRQGPRKHKE